MKLLKLMYDLAEEYYWDTESSMLYENNLCDVPILVYVCYDPLIDRCETCFTFGDFEFFWRLDYECDKRWFLNFYLPNRSHIVSIEENRRHYLNYKLNMIIRRTWINKNLTKIKSELIDICNECLLMRI